MDEARHSVVEAYRIKMATNKETAEPKDLEESKENETKIEPSADSTQKILDDDLDEIRFSPWRSRIESMIEDAINNRNLVPSQKPLPFTFPDLEGMDVSLQQASETHNVALVE